MRRILYLNNFMTQTIVNSRKNQNIYSQPANNKIAGITEALLANDCEVKILSSGLVNGKSGRLYKEVREKALNVDVLFCPIIDFPFINTISSILFTYRQIKKENSEKKVDNIIFYNYKPEVAWTAWLAKKRLGIPITIELEDGYSHISEIRGLKTWIFNYTEKKVKKCVDAAILVNSSLAKEYAVPCVVVRGIVNKKFLKKCKEYKKEKNKKFTILYSGGLDQERGVDVLLQALKYMDIDCRIIVSGKGSIKCDDPRVEFKGFVSYEEVQRLMMESDLLVQCQLSKKTFANASFPSKLFEYIATGNMIVSSNIDEVKAFAGDAFTFYENDNPKELAEAITSLYQKREKKQWKNKMDILCRENMPETVGQRIVKILT